VDSNAQPRVLGVIPARGGSKGIPRKNIYPLHGKPLIAYTIEPSLASSILTDVMVTTDDEEIADVSREYGALVPFMRPADLGTDSAQAIPTIQHAVREMETLRDYHYDVVVMLQPTTPLRTSQDIDESVRKLIDTDADSVISVVDVGGHHPMRMKQIVEDTLIDYDDEAIENMPRQDLPAVYLRAGSIYATRRDVLMIQGSFKGEISRPFIIPPDRAVNIDIMPDMVVAEWRIGQMLKGR
jgi:D-3-phosphoglycerate dehydrogenase / 2-oxoglutarate reductase